MVSKLQFLLFYTIFLFFLIQISSMAGQEIVWGVSEMVEYPSPPVIPALAGKNPLERIAAFFYGIFSVIKYLIDNLVYFFRLMGVSTSFGLFGAVILTPFVLVLVWTIFELIRGI